jgi:squalene-hopene/tetraprenyl-beta-curcumene cyclase
MNTTCLNRFELSRCFDFRLGIAVLTIFSLGVEARAQDSKKPQKPEFQYQLGDIRVSIPSADEPRVKAFGSESLKAAAKYLEVGALSYHRTLHD